MAPDETGRLAINLAASPLAWFTGYLGRPEATREKLSDDGLWFYTGDVASVDSDGYFRFFSRDDDVIIMSGYRIGPSDIEAVISSHPAISECAVVAGPDAVRGEVLQAFAVTSSQADTWDALAAEIQDLVRSEYGAHAYPRRVHFLEQLPRTPSGKIQRFVLRAQLSRSRPGVDKNRLNA